jgi:translation initiation factor IF-3
MANTLIMNEKIRVSEVQLTGLQGEDLGIVSRDKALTMARELKADLVCLSLMSSPPPCKLMARGQAKQQTGKAKRGAAGSGGSRPDSGDGWSYTGSADGIGANGGYGAGARYGAGGGATAGGGRANAGGAHAGAGAKGGSGGKAGTQPAKVKELRLTPHIEEHDYDTKLRQAAKLLASGNGVQLVVRIQGKEGAKAKELLERLVRDLAASGKKQTGIQVSGKQAAVQLLPL